MFMVLYFSSCSIRVVDESPMIRFHFAFNSSEIANPTGISSEFPYLTPRSKLINFESSPSALSIALELVPGPTPVSKTIFGFEI